MPEAKKPGLAHSFNSPASEAVLSLHQLLVKVISAKELPRSSTAQRRNVSVEVTLVGSGGATIEGGMHSRTGPPNHFSTVKDTAPVWNAEFVSEVSEELLSGANLRFDVWDDATSPPVHMGAALLEEAALRELRNRDEERSLPIRPEHASSAPGGGGGALRLRVALVDVRDALARLPEAEAKATQAQHRVDAAEREQNGARVGMRLLASALQEEESQVAVLRHRTPGTVRVRVRVTLTLALALALTLTLTITLILTLTSTLTLTRWPCCGMAPLGRKAPCRARSAWTRGWRRRRRTRRWLWRPCATRRSRRWLTLSLSLSLSLSLTLTLSLTLSLTRRWGRSWACTSRPWRPSSRTCARRRNGTRGSMPWQWTSCAPSWQRRRRCLGASGARRRPRPSSRLSASSSRSSPPGHGR